MPNDPRQDDALGPARRIVGGLLLSLALWCAGGLCLSWLWR